MEIQLWKETMVPYKLAVKELTVKFEDMIAQYRQMGMYSPIEKVEGRVKSLSSILEKVQKKGIPIEQATSRLEDIAGIRLICQFVEDIGEVVAEIKSRTDMRVLDEIDYITYTKPSGYRSYHVIVEYTVQTIYGVQTIPVEIQIRTLAMNFWAVIEHSLKYKYKGNVPEHVKTRLTAAAQATRSLDYEMSQIRGEVQAAQQIFKEKANLVADILGNLQALYRSENKKAIINIQDEFYHLYEHGSLEELEAFCRRLDAVAARRNVQKIQENN